MFTPSEFDFIIIYIINDIYIITYNFSGTIWILKTTLRFVLFECLHTVKTLYYA